MIHHGFATLLFCIVNTVLFADVNSGSGTIPFSINGGDTIGMTLDSMGLGIGTLPSANLHVSGNVIVTQRLVIGTSTPSTSNLHVQGTLSMSLDQVSSHTNILEHSQVLADSSSGNITLTLPSISSVGPGRIYRVKKKVSDNQVLIVGERTIDGNDGIVLGSGNAGAVQLVSSSDQWHILSGLDFTPYEAPTYRYFRWLITGNKGATAVQASELLLYNTDSDPIASNNLRLINLRSATISNPDGNFGASEGPGKLADGSTASKHLDYDFSVNGSTNITIDAGTGNTIRADRFQFATGNDSVTRDPDEWTWYGSDDNITWIALGSTCSPVSSIPSGRQTYTPLMSFSGVNLTFPSLHSTASYRYVRWTITGTRSSTSQTQASELNLCLAGVEVSYTGATITHPGASNIPSAAEGAQKLFDNNTGTKMFDNNFGSNGNSTVIIDMGSGNTLSFDSMSYSTGNDNSSRDPFRWTIEGSNDNTNWTTLLSAFDYLITTARGTGTSVYPISN